MIVAAVLAASLCPASQALERITLRTGFSYDCSHHEAIDASHVRLYLASSDPTRTDNYQDLAADLIVRVETIPDPVVISPPTPAPTPEALDVPTLLAHAGTQHNIDVDLLAAVVKAESGGRANAVSRVGARGLMQLMPGTARDLGVDDAFRPDQNIAGGTAYLDYLLDRYDPRGDKHGLDLALAAYNAGPAAVDRYHGIPPFRETRAYVARVEREFNRRKKAAASTVVVASVAH
jgi:soluble lytic murein transglycosylase-like protein